MEIAEHPFFRDTQLENIRDLQDRALPQTFNTKDVIFEEGSVSDGLYLVLEGRVDFIKCLPGGAERGVSFSQAGDFFGEIGLFTGEPRSLTARAATRVSLAVIPRASLVDFIHNTPGPVELILQSIINHLHHTTRHYIDDILKQEKMALVGNMVGTIIHDFKNPFTLISLGAQLMMKAHDDPQTVRICQNMQAQVQRMVEMAAELAEFSKGEQHLRVDKVQTTRLLRRFKELNEPYFNHDRVALRLSADLIELEAEENKLLRILQNLVGNAIEAFDSGVSGNVDIQLRDTGENEITITVSDDGPGIPEPIRAQFFEPFVTYGKSRGTGLGTAIVKSLVEAHGGDISFTTETGEGTTFTIRLPKRQTEKA